jgi:hypothetical protein
MKNLLDLSKNRTAIDHAKRNVIRSMNKQVISTQSRDATEGNAEYTHQRVIEASAGPLSGRQGVASCKSVCVT